MEETSLVKEVKKIAKISPSNCLQTQKTLLSLENSARTTRPTRSVSLGTYNIALVTDPSEILGWFHSMVTLHKEWI